MAKASQLCLPEILSSSFVGPDTNRPSKKFFSKRDNGRYVEF